MNELVLTYYSEVKDSRLQRNVSERLANELKSFEGKRVEIRVQRLKSTRSVQQNRLLWLYSTILSKDLGYDKNEMHEIIKYKFLRKEKVDERSGEVFDYVGSTTKLSKSEFADMINDLIRWSAETLGIVLPLPSEQLTIEQ